MSKARDLASAIPAPSTVSSAELGYLDGVTSAIQTQINTKQAVVSGVDNTEIGYLDGVTSAIQTQIDSKLSSTISFNAQTGTTYTLVAGDATKLVTTSNASAITVTVPPSVFTAGQQINVQSIGVGLTSFAQGAGVTITSTGATASAPILRARYSACTIVCTASNTFTILGDIS